MEKREINIGKTWNFNIKNRLTNLVETLQDECPAGTEHGIRILDQLDD